VISQELKNAYYGSVGRLSIVSLAYHRAFKAKKYRDKFVNVGCGPKYVDDMVNIDGNLLRHKDVWLDVRFGLPFENDSIAGIYASHIIEHLSWAAVRKVAKEFHRVLRPGGVARIVVPSLEYAIDTYVHQQGDRFSSWPEEFESLGGRFNNFMLCANQHLLMFDRTLLAELFTGAGFRKSEVLGPKISAHFAPSHLQYEGTEDRYESSLHFEATK
jgi:predicted SAM-dependent methyltransferase